MQLLQCIALHLVSCSTILDPERGLWQGLWAEFGDTNSRFRLLCIVMVEAPVGKHPSSHF